MKKLAFSGLFLAFCVAFSCFVWIGDTIDLRTAGEMSFSATKSDKLYRKLRASEDETTNEGHQTTENLPIDLQINFENNGTDKISPNPNSTAEKMADPDSRLGGETQKHLDESKTLKWFPYPDFWAEKKSNRDNKFAADNLKHSYDTSHKILQKYDVPSGGILSHGDESVQDNRKSMSETETDKLLPDFEREARQDDELPRGNREYADETKTRELSQESEVSPNKTAGQDSQRRQSDPNHVYRIFLCKKSPESEVPTDDKDKQGNKCATDSRNYAYEEVLDETTQKPGISIDEKANQDNRNLQNFEEYLNRNQAAEKILAVSRTLTAKIGAKHSLSAKNNHVNSFAELLRKIMEKYGTFSGKSAVESNPAFQNVQKHFYEPKSDNITPDVEISTVGTARQGGQLNQKVQKSLFEGMFGTTFRKLEVSTDETFDREEKRAPTTTQRLCTEDAYLTRVGACHSLDKRYQVCYDSYFRNIAPCERINFMQQVSLCIKGSLRFLVTCSKIPVNVCFSSGVGTTDVELCHGSAAMACVGSGGELELCQTVRSRRSPESTEQPPNPVGPSPQLDLDAYYVACANCTIEVSMIVDEESSDPAVVHIKAEPRYGKNQAEKPLG